MILLNTDRSEPFVVEPGMRIAQLVIVELPSVELVEVDEPPASERGERPRLSGTWCGRSRGSAFQRAAMARLDPLVSP